MPGIVTHHVFGTDVYRGLAAVIGETPHELDAFLLGNLGPDPFFYLAATPLSGDIRRIGGIMHRRATPELLAAMHMHFIAAGGGASVSGRGGVSDVSGAGGRGGTGGASSTSGAGDASGAGNPRKAYALGFLCHYLLDSTVHPLVYAQQHAIYDATVEGLKGIWTHRVVHATIETALDEYMFTTRLGATAATLPPHRTMLRCPVAALFEVSRCFGKVIPQVYGLSAPDTLFATAVGLNRAGQQALDSKSNGIRRRFDYLALAGMASAYVQALSHRVKPALQVTFANDDHVPWPDPYNEGVVVDASFDELYQQALSKAVSLIPEFCQPGAPASFFAAIAGNVNFLGRACE